MRLLPAVTLLLVPPILALQQPLVSLTRTTLLDVLNNDPHYTLLLRLLQRARLIPTLSRLNNTTFFAPTDDAIKDYAPWHDFLQDDPSGPRDNVQEHLRQQLFYHLLNGTVTSLPSDSANKPIVYRTLHYPRTPEPPSRDPPPSPPWIPIPGGTLGGEPQRLRGIARGDNVFIGVDAFGRGDAMVINRAEASNGIVYGLTKVLEPPADLAHVISHQPAVSYFYKVLKPEITNLLNSTSALSLFLPVDAAWEALDPYERLYLESEYAADDLERILNMHAVLDKSVRYYDSFTHRTNLTTIDGNKLEICKAENTTIGGASLVEPDIYASNGVLHLVESLLVPPGSLLLTPEKYLLALNCTTFVSLLHSVNLTSLINNTDAKYTILAPRDDVFSDFHQGVLPERGSEELKKLLQYHFIPGKWGEKKLETGILLETELKEEGLGNGRQVLTVEVTSDPDKNDAVKAVRFGGAGTIGPPIDVNETLVYFLSRPLVPPEDALQTALPKLDLSSFLAAIFSTSQADTLKKTPRTTLFIPHNSAFKRLGMLVSEHLLAASSKQDLERVLLHHTLDTVEYAESLKNGSQHTFATLEGTDLQLDQLPNGTIYVRPSGGWRGMQAELYVKNTLTKTGVIHELSDLLLPRSVNLTVGKLVRAARGNTMASMAIKAGFEWVLNGTAPPEGTPWAEGGLAGAGWTLICPTDDAFRDLNLTQILADVQGLQALVAQHLIPTSPLKDLSGILDHDAFYNNRPVPFDDAATYSTLHSAVSAYGDITFRWRDGIQPNGYVVGIKGARGTDGASDSARVLSWGRSTLKGGGGVIQVDRLLVPYYPPWWIAYGAPAGVGLGGCLIIIGFFYGVRLLWLRDTTEATYEPQGGFGRDDDEEP